MGEIRLKRAYDEPAQNDGRRVLVDRIWPRGVKKEELELDDWFKQVAPSSDLRKWFDHDPQKWNEFKQRYFDELKNQPEEIQSLLTTARKGRLTLVYAASEEKYNNAVALKEFLQKNSGL
ncbi:MAG: DUF488 domain-containing protein [Desulfuromonadales bacterium]|nr:DUF488 domain-containing protein [Desulfuromonadales bacterium]